MGEALDSVVERAIAELRALVPLDHGRRLDHRRRQRGSRRRGWLNDALSDGRGRFRTRLGAAGRRRRPADDRRLDGIFAVNDLMALGVVDAVRAAGREGDVKVVGFDGIPQALAAISRGRLSVTVAQYPYTMGQLAVEACLAAVGGRGVPATIDAPVQVVTGDNVARARANFPAPVAHFDDPLGR